MFRLSFFQNRFFRKTLTEFGFFNELPRELKIHILSQSSSIKDIHSLRKVNREFRGIVNSKGFWQAMYQNFFPYLYELNKNKIKDTWFDEFKKRIAELKEVDRRYHSLFLAAYQGKIHSLIPSMWHDIEPMLDLFFNNKTSLLTLLRVHKDKKALNAIFQLIKTKYTRDRISYDFFLKWALLCDQPFSIIKEIIGNGAHITGEDYWGSPLEIAINNNLITPDQKIIHYFLEKGAVPGFSSFLGAIVAGNNALVTLFLEKYKINGVEKTVLVHRKGATRAFPNQPVFIPGDMGRYSYLLVGQQGAMDESFGSVCHGAGRALSRTQAKKIASAEDIKVQLKEKGIIVKSTTRSGLTEEISEAYKDVKDVVNVIEGAGLASIVAKLRPIGVVKG